MPCPSAEDPICSTQVREARQQGTEERRRLPFSKVCSRHRVGGREQMPTSSADCSPRSLVQPGTCTTARLAQETQLPQLQEASWLEEESIYIYILGHKRNIYCEPATYGALFCMLQTKSLLSRSLHFSPGRQTDAHTQHGCVCFSVCLHMFVCMYVCSGSDSKGCGEK